MHIPDGIVPVVVSIAGYGTASLATWISLKKINKFDNPQESVPKAALLTAGFFVASWIHIPIPPLSVHFVLNGLMGVVLGYYAFPAILIGLLFQAVMFQHGGLTTLGLNATIMGLPALLSFFIFRMKNHINFGNKRIITGVFGFLGGSIGLGLATLFAFSILILTIPGSMDVAAEQASIKALSIAHIPLMIIEGVFTSLVILFIEKVKPSMIETL